MYIFRHDDKFSLSTINAQEGLAGPPARTFSSLRRCVLLVRSSAHWILVRSEPVLLVLLLTWSCTLSTQQLCPAWGWNPASYASTPVLRPVPAQNSVIWRLSSCLWHVFYLLWYFFFNCRVLRVLLYFRYKIPIKYVASNNNNNNN